APPRELVLVGDFGSQNESELCRLGHRGEIPVRLEFVGGLMVVLRVVSLEHPLAIARRLTVEFCAHADGERRNAGVRERKMVRAEIVALLGMGIRLNGKIEPFRDTLRYRQYAGPLRARNDNGLGPP